MIEASFSETDGRHEVGEIQRHVWVSGEVQGVGFRAWVFKQVSHHAGIRGFVRNLEDGRVEALFTGDSASVLRLVSDCCRGPRSSRVTGVQVVEEAVDVELEPFAVK